MRRLILKPGQILQFRRSVGSLDERLAFDPHALRVAAWAGLQDSAPRAALLSLHARVQGVEPDSWEHPSLVQVWGPRFNDYVVAAEDWALFTLGRLPAGGSRHQRAHETADRLEAFLQGRRMPFGAAGRAMGVDPNSLRYATLTGRVLLRWDGARQPVIWTVPAPALDPAQARRGLALRYLRVFGPGTGPAFARWGGVSAAQAAAVWAELAPELIPVRTSAGDAWIRAEDEPALREVARPPAPARLLPSGDAFYLAWGPDRELLVPDPAHRARLWTARVWPGALVVRGAFAGVWSRAAGHVILNPWHNLTRAERDAVEAEAAALPLPGVGRVTMRWTG